MDVFVQRIFLCPDDIMTENYEDSDRINATLVMNPKIM
jgi:hypothetical protein